VAGTFETGFYEYDNGRIYVGIDTLRRFMGLDPAMATAVEARVRDPRRITETAAAVQGTLGQDYYVNDLVRMNRTFFSALRLEKLAMSISIGLIILVAALNIVSILVLLVMEKVRDIGVLAAMGATAPAIRRIFALQGLVIAGIGTLAGAALGVGLAWSLDHWRLVALPPDVYFIPYVPFHVRPLDVATVVAITFGVSFLATLYPAWRAAQLDPSEALRYE
jgi:lipoprotein-releasing system permease protein